MKTLVDWFINSAMKIVPIVIMALTLLSLLSEKNNHPWTRSIQIIALVVSSSAMLMLVFAGTYKIYAWVNAKFRLRKIPQ